MTKLSNFYKIIVCCGKGKLFINNLVTVPVKWI